VNDPKQITREELLRLGGLAALATGAALAGSPAAADAADAAKPKPKTKPTHAFNNNPIGLDLTSSTDAVRHNGKVTAPKPVPVHRVKVSKYEADVHSADVIYTVGAPTYKSHQPDGHDDDDDLGYTVWVGIWLPKT
jgi:hypothetical protein